MSVILLHSREYFGAFVNSPLSGPTLSPFPSLHQAIGTRLSELCHSDSESPANILGYIFDEETKRRMRKEDEEEDYLDDSESGCSVPCLPLDGAKRQVCFEVAS